MYEQMKWIYKKATAQYNYYKLLIRRKVHTRKQTFVHKTRNSTRCINTYFMVIIPTYPRMDLLCVALQINRHSVQLTLPFYKATPLLWNPSYIIRGKPELPPQDVMPSFVKLIPANTMMDFIGSVSGAATNKSSESELLILREIRESSSSNHSLCVCAVLQLELEFLFHRLYSKHRDNLLVCWCESASNCHFFWSRSRSNVFI